MEKAQRSKGKVQSAMFYPVAVMFVAGGVMTLMMLFVIPKFKDVFAGLTRQRRPASVHHLRPGTSATRHCIMRSAPDHAGGQRHLPLLTIRTKFGRFAFDQFN